MTKAQLIEVFDRCRAKRCGIAVDLKMPNQEQPERIINHYTSLKVKQKYYEETYDDELRHKNNEFIKIINAKPIEVASFSNIY